MLPRLLREQDAYTWGMGRFLGPPAEAPEGQRPSRALLSEGRAAVATGPLAGRGVGRAHLA